MVGNIDEILDASYSSVTLPGPGALNTFGANSPRNAYSAIYPQRSCSPVNSCGNRNVQKRIELTAGCLRLTLSPSVGGAISAFEWVGEGIARPILRQCHSPLEKVLDACCFPLVPYVNRVRGGCFIPWARGPARPQHGRRSKPAARAGLAEPVDGRTSGRTSARAQLPPRAGEWPWAYEARQEFALDERACRVRLSCRNTVDEPMPCGLGVHPYFPCGPQTRIDTRVACAWTIDEKVLPVDQVPAEGATTSRIGWSAVRISTTASAAGPARRG